jgi:hypothetical protein
VWKIDHQRVGGAVGAVILSKPVPQTPGLDSYDRIQARIIIRATVENVAAYSILFQLVRFACQGSFNSQPQKALETCRVPEALAGQDSFDMTVNLSRLNGFESACQRVYRRFEGVPRVSGLNWENIHSGSI